MSSENDRPNWVPPLLGSDTFKLRDGRIFRIRGSSEMGWASTGAKDDYVVWGDVFDEEQGQWVPLNKEFPVSEIQEPWPDPVSPWLKSKPPWLK